MERLTMQQLENDLKNISGGTILDVGTGQGEFINLLINSLGGYEKIIGIDTQEKHLNAAAEKFSGKNVEFRQMDAYASKFPPASFDMVTISNSLHHFSDIAQVLTNMKELLKDEGYFLVNEMHSDEQQTEAQKTHIKMHHWWGKIDSRLGIVHQKTYTSEQIEKILKKLHLKELNIYEYAYQIANPQDEKMIKKYISYFDPYVDRLIEHKDYNKLKAEGEALKDRLKKVGFAPASSLFIIGRK